MKFDYSVIFTVTCRILSYTYVHGKLSYKAIHRHNAPLPIALLKTIHSNFCHNTLYTSYKPICIVSFRPSPPSTVTVTVYTDQIVMVTGYKTW